MAEASTTGERLTIPPMEHRYARTASVKRCVEMPSMRKDEATAVKAGEATPLVACSTVDLDKGLEAWSHFLDHGVLEPRASTDTSRNHTDEEERVAEMSADERRAEVEWQYLKEMMAKHSATGEGQFEEQYEQELAAQHHNSPEARRCDDTALLLEENEAL